MENEFELAIIDYHYLLNKFENCQKYKLVVPYAHIKTLENLLISEKRNISIDNINQILSYIRKNAIILKSNVLPEIHLETKGIKPKTQRFVRYVLLAKNKYPNIRVISDSRETKYLLKQLNIQISSK